jgi:hypothetical protein
MSRRRLPLIADRRLNLRRIAQRSGNGSTPLPQWDATDEAALELVDVTKT